MNEVPESALDSDSFVEAVAHRVKSNVGARLAICRKRNGDFTWTRLEPANVYGMRIDLLWEGALRIIGEGGLEEEIEWSDNAVQKASDFILRVAIGGVAQRRLGPVPVGRQLIADERIESWVRQGRCPRGWRVWEPW